MARMKQCPRCEEEKPHTLEFFGRNRNMKRGLHVWCKLCTKLYARKQRGVTEETLKRHVWIPGSTTQTCSKCKIEKPLSREHFIPGGNNRSGFVSHCRTCMNKAGRERNVKLKTEMFQAYGQKCACCELTEPRFLTIEHKNHDGAAHRKKVGGGGISVWVDLRRRNWPKKDYELLCWNCNMVTRNGDQCFHKVGLTPMPDTSQDPAKFPPEGEKWCPRCQKHLPATTEYFRRNKRRKHGLGDWCKACFVAYKRGNLKWLPRRKSADPALKLKAEMIQAYGGSCQCCGEKELKALTLEHQNGDGAAHRRKFNGSIYSVWLDLKRRGWPKDGYAIYCWNCNFSERTGMVCPHKEVA